jgi:hypothetical protein
VAKDGTSNTVPASSRPSTGTIAPAAARLRGVPV